MNVIPAAQVPAGGPNFYNLDDDVLYAFNFDLNQDGIADDLVIEFKFDTEIRDSSKAGGLNFKDVPIAYAGVRPITALDGPGSEGIGLRQEYRIRAGAGAKSPGENMAKIVARRSVDVNKKPLTAVPSNLGPATMPDYPALAAQGIFDLGAGVRVFVGQREETFYIDLGSAFDTLNFRRTPPILTLGEDQNDTQNPFGVDDALEGLNVTTIALEIPKSLLPSQTVGVYASTSRKKNRKFVSAEHAQALLILGQGRRFVEVHAQQLGDVPEEPENTGEKYDRRTVERSVRPDVGNGVPKTALKRTASLGFS